MREKIFITKYALRSGVFTRECETGSKYAYTVQSPNEYGRIQVVIGKDGFRNEAEAKIAAEKMRQAKIASLKKQIAKLEKMKF